MKKRSTAAIVIAVILSIVFVPFLLAFGFSGATTLAVSNVVAEEREDELFSAFEQAGGIRFIYDKVDNMLRSMERSISMPEDAELFQNVILYEDVSSIAHGVYSAFLNGEVYKFDLSVQKERLKANVEEYFDHYMKEQNFDVPVDTEGIKEEYLKEPYAQIDQEIAKVETQLNDALDSVYELQRLPEFSAVKRRYGEGTLRLSWIREGLGTATVTIIGIAAAAALFLLAAHLFRPSDFFVTGSSVLLLGGCSMLASRLLAGLSVSKLLSSMEVPHESIYAAANQVVCWAADGYQSFSIYSAVTGAALLLIGVVLLLVFRKNASEADV